VKHLIDPQCLGRRAAHAMLVVLGFVASAAFATPGVDKSVMASARVQESPPKIILSWPTLSDSTQIEISRKARDATSWGSVRATLSGWATTYEDRGVSTGSAYEYKIRKVGTTDAYGYVYAGIQVPLVDERGKIVLVVDDTYAADLAAELGQLERDLAGDGWTVLRHDVDRSESVTNVKALVKAEYDADPTGVKAVYLFGHVPVAYSGQIAPDGHTTHVGAWPADVYYGDMNGVWTDTTKNWTDNADHLDNVPGDGKFDQSSLPSDVELMVGRVDTAEMPAFALSEKELLRQYLTKAHAFRHRALTAPLRGLVDDNFTGYPEGFSQTGWRSFSAFFGASNVTAGTWSDLRDNAYLWGYGCGGGTYSGASGIGTTGDYAYYTYRAVFQILFGSMFGDWDVHHANNFLRAPLCGPDYGLVCFWAGRPTWYLHHMALGEPVGHDARLTQNNDGLYLPDSSSERRIHVALMGDPTLRLRYVAPCSELAATAEVHGGSVTSVSLAWPIPPDDVAGYHVYRGVAGSGPFTRLTGALLTTNFYSDATMPTGTVVYMVRPVALLEVPGGSYYDAAQGVTDEIFVEEPVTGPSVPTGLTAAAVGTSRIDLAWGASQDAESGIREYRVYRGGVLAVSTVATNYSDAGLPDATTFSYEVSAVNGCTVESARSAPAQATTATDTDPPTLVDVSALGTRVAVRVAFSEPVELASATNTANYEVDHGITVSGATLESDLRTVQLAVIPLASCTSYTLTVNNVRDRATTPNTIAADSTAGFVVDLTLTAYNDLNGTQGTNITFYGMGQDGLLVDYTAGWTSDVHLAVAGSATAVDLQGALSQAGTEGYHVFAGVLDAGDVLSYGTTTNTFTGLDPELRYELVVFGNRDEHAYTNRTSVFTLFDADAFYNESSIGAQIGTTVAANDTTTIGTGYNTEAGYVARFTRIDPGTNGTIRLVVGGTHGYVNALRLRGVARDVAAESVAVYRSTTWRYLRGTREASVPVTDWRTFAAFDDAGWTDGAAPFGYGDGPYGTELDDMQTNYACVFLRRPFLVSQPAMVQTLRLWANYDDAFLMWINGQEVARVNMGGTPGSLVPYDALALSQGEPLQWSNTLSAAAMPLLVPGTNLLAIQAFNGNLDSSDLTLDAELVLVEAAAAADDQDADGIADSWEALRGIAAAGPAADSDGDGARDLDEYIAGTDPTNAASVFELWVSHSNSQAVVSVDAPRADGTGYEGRERHLAIEVRSQLTGDLWQGVPGYTNLLGTNQLIECVVSPEGDQPQFYRVRVWLE